MRDVGAGPEEFGISTNIGGVATLGAARGGMSCEGYAGRKRGASETHLVKTMS